MNTDIRIEKMGTGHIAIIKGVCALQPGEVQGLTADEAERLVNQIANAMAAALRKTLTPKLTRKAA